MDVQHIHTQLCATISLLTLRYLYKDSNRGIEVRKWHYEHVKLTY